MTFNQALTEDRLHLRLEGDLIGEQNGAEIVEVAGESMNRGARYILIDIEKVRYINSSGIGVLITLLTKFRNSGGEAYLIKPSEHVKKLLIITKLQAIFNIVESEAEAITAIGK